MLSMYRVSFPLEYALAGMDDAATAIQRHMKLSTKAFCSKSHHKTNSRSSIKAISAVILLNRRQHGSITIAPAFDLHTFNPVFAFDLGK